MGRDVVPDSCEISVITQRQARKALALELVFRVGL